VTSVAEAAALVPQAFREHISLLPAEGGPDGAAWAASSRGCWPAASTTGA
jgi:streptomycin 6-kinase